MSIGKINSIENVNRDTPMNNLERTQARDQSAEQPKDPRVMDAAKMYERHFLNEMVKAMRSTVSEGELTKSGMADKIYKDQLDTQYVEQWSDTGGVGLADLIYDELMNKILNKMNGREFGPKGPIALSDRDISRVTKAPSSIDKQTAFKVELKPNGQESGPAHIQAPWDSKVLTTTRVDGKSTILLEHDGGVRSALIFDGVLSPVKPGDSLKRGTQIGVLSPETRSLLWNLRGPAETSAQLTDNTANFSGPDNAPRKTE